MKIEEITSQKEENGHKVRRSWLDYWFPLPKGYNRLLIVLACLVILYVASESHHEERDFLATLLAEIIAYVVFIWVYRGFKV